ncbi:hypothetical protein Vadar_004860 [Vaccinium darrowii]|uniref:Uncharacterized protein n=1 Tax=Vaccinium darrowii TaxID=229202 RepID=A0ACB7YJN0_9ERIC|nr:hypothetical protein Vadar_004860 [Vaccinium darrowii]
MPIPLQTDVHRALRGLISKDLADRIVSLRNRIVLVAEDTSRAFLLSSFFDTYFSFGIALIKGLNEVELFYFAVRVEVVGGGGGGGGSVGLAVGVGVVDGEEEVHGEKI